MKTCKEQSKAVLGYKICSASLAEVLPCLVTLEIPKTARCIPTEFADNGDVLAYRCDWAKVIRIDRLEINNAVVSIADGDIDMAYNCFYNPHNKYIRYRTGNKVWVKNYDDRNYISYSNGIYYFTSQIAAVSYYLGGVEGGD